MYNERVAQEIENLIRNLYAPLIHSLERSLAELSHEEK